jgi:hypothetical protein
MRNLLMIGVALAALGAAMPAYAQTSNDSKAVAGATVGGATGGTIGFLLGGPIGAIVGGWAGAVIGGEAAVSEASIRYAGENPVDVIYLEGDLAVGSAFADDVTVYPIAGDDQYGYIYADLAGCRRLRRSQPHDLDHHRRRHRSWLPVRWRRGARRNPRPRQLSLCLR